MTTGYDVGGLVPQIRPCPGCGQADPWHLTVCPSQPEVQQGVTPATVAAVNEEEKHLGMAV
jgi:hypothetical protein